MHATIANQNSYYTPACIDRWLRDWQLLASLAETPHSSRHCLTLQHQIVAGACPENLRQEQRHPGYHGDALRYADVKADLETAWNALGPATREFKLIYLVMQGYPLRAAGDLLGRSVEPTHRYYWRAVQQMSVHLGIDKPKHNPYPDTMI